MGSKSIRNDLETDKLGFVEWEHGQTGPKSMGKWAEGPNMGQERWGKVGSGQKWPHQGCAFMKSKI